VCGGSRIFFGGKPIWRTCSRFGRAVARLFSRHCLTQGRRLLSYATLPVDRPKQLRQLYAQVLACIHGLHNADVEFVMAVRIDGLAAQLCGKTRPSRRNLGAEVSAMLERAIRSRRACAGELVA